jgi:hypothetical protein
MISLHAFTRSGTSSVHTIRKKRACSIPGWTNLCPSRKRQRRSIASGDCRPTRRKRMPGDRPTRFARADVQPRRADRRYRRAIARIGA